MIVGYIYPYNDDQKITCLKKKNNYDTKYILLYIVIHMKKFGIYRNQKKTRKSYLKYINGTFVILAMFCFIFFTFFAKISDMMFSKNKIDVFKEDLGQIAFYTWTFDKELSKFLITIDDIVQSYTKGENIFITKEKEIHTCREYIEKNKEYLKKV